MAETATQAPFTRARTEEVSRLSGFRLVADLSLGLCGIKKCTREVI